MADRPSVEGPRQVVSALMGPKGVPKRKSLTGLFGLSMKKSFERIKGGDAKLRANVEWGSPKLRSLAEELEDAGIQSTEVQSDLKMPQVLYGQQNEDVTRADRTSSPHQQDSADPSQPVYAESLPQPTSFSTLSTTST